MDSKEKSSDVSFKDSDFFVMEKTIGYGIKINKLVMGLEEGQCMSMVTWIINHHA